MHKTLILTALLIGPALGMHGAVTKFTTNFPSNRMPSGIEVKNVDELPLAAERYRNVQTSSSWFVGALGTGNMSALAATCGTGGETRCLRMTLPAVTVQPGATVRWDARSMSRAVGEWYKVSVECNGTVTDLLRVEGENYCWTTRCESLEPWEGKDVRVRFETLEQPVGSQPFMLALDNILVGVDDQKVLRWTDTTRHYVANDDDAAVSGTLTNYGCDIAQLTLTATFDGGKAAQVTYTDVKNGQTLAVEIPVETTANTSADYTLKATADGTDITLGSGYVVASTFARTVVIEHFTGLWCNNCPIENLSAYEYMETLGDQAIVTDSHVTDVLTHQAYWDNHGAEFVFNVPNVAINHNRECASTVNGTTAREAELRRGANARIDALYTISADGGSVSISSEVETAFSALNTSGRYRLGYMLLADEHNPLEPRYIQSNSPTGANWQEYYYMPANILPAYNRFENVVIEGTSAGAGVASSLPTMLEAFTPVSSSHTIAIPEAWQGRDLKVVVMLLDTADNSRVLNAALAVRTAPSGVESVNTAAPATDGCLYDLYGRRVANPTPGIYIRDGRKVLIKNN